MWAGKTWAESQTHEREESLMAKQVEELFEVPEAEEQPAKKQNLHVVIALRHLNKRRGVLLEKRAAVTKEIEELDAAILALE